MVKTYSVKKDGNKKLSNNFTVKEFACKDGSDAVLISEELVNLLQNIRDHFGKAVTLNSAYRNATYNKKIGGASRSQHVYGTAADVVVQGVKPEDVAKYAEYLMPKTGGIGLYSTFTHIDVRSARARWKNFGTEVSISGFPGYKPADELTEACKLLASKGIINSPDYWAKGKGYSDENVRHLIRAFAKYAKGVNA